ncbi:MAG TPA: DUF2252 family protein [Anaerolineae bacterium]|nr:DUF2252 family protein [Anaerolineae bacterium]
MLLIEAASTFDLDRTKIFAEFAQKRAEGNLLVPPTLLSKEARRLHIRQTLREDHQFRLNNRPEGAQEKFDKLAKSPFTFFRGTALLYYRDYAGIDAHLPYVFTIGDVHPENFGVMPNEDGAPVFGIDDFDEAYIAPFSWDVRRGSVGFYIVAKENGLSRKNRDKIVRAFIGGYLEGLKEYARDDREKWHGYRIDTSPGMIKELLEEAQSGRKAFLADLIELDKERFVSSDKIVPHSKYIGKFQEAIDQYRQSKDIDERGRAGHFKVKDVAIKKGSGTASLGLDRFFVLIDGPTDDPGDDIILEIKQARQSALHGLVPDRSNGKKGSNGQRKNSKKAERIVEAHAVHLVGGDPYYGHATIDDISFLVRERSPYKHEIEVDDLSKAELKEYAEICGKVLAQTHARSDQDTGILEGEAEKQILSSINLKVFTEDMVRFAHRAAKRIYKDHQLFQKDHSLGAFNFVTK